MNNLSPTKNQYALDVLKANKARFTGREYRILTLIAEHGAYDYRKGYEAADDCLPYLPSFAQRVAAKLAVCGLEIRAIPANDGTCRKKYALSQLAPDYKAAIKKTLDGFGFGIYGEAE